MMMMEEEKATPESPETGNSVSSESQGSKDNQNDPACHSPESGNPDATSTEARPEKLAKKPKPQPDWQPLGHVRDYFYEQMKQDPR